MTFQVKLNQNGQEFTCESGQSILDAALHHGITIPYGCRNGLCGSCKGVVIEGQVEYPEGIPDGIIQEDVDAGAALFCKATPVSDVIIEATVIETKKSFEVKKMPAKVKQLELLSDDVMRMMLQLPAVENFEFRAGQWINFILKEGKKRAFSIANTPNQDKQLEIHIRHAYGGLFTDFVFNQLKIDDLLQIEGPHGTFFYQQSDAPLLLVAGGTGFAPIKGILEEILDSEQKLPPIHLFWGSRACKDLYQDDLVRQWVQQHGIQYTPVLSDPDESDQWSGDTGFVHQAVVKAYPDMTGFAVYMAGPPQMIESCKSSFIPLGVKEQHIYYDSFDYSTDALDAMKGDNG